MVKVAELACSATAGVALARRQLIDLGVEPPAVDPRTCRCLESELDRPSKHADEPRLGDVCDLSDRGWGFENKKGTKVVMPHWACWGEEKHVVAKKGEAGGSKGADIIGGTAKRRQSHATTGLDMGRYAVGNAKEKRGYSPEEDFAHRNYFFGVSWWPGQDSSCASCCYSALLM